MNKPLLILVVLSLLSLSCENNNLGTVDTSKEIPQLSDAVVSPDSIYLDNLTPVNERYTVTATLRVKSTISGSISQTVTATLVRPNAATEFLQLAPTVSNVFTGQLQFTVTRPQAGTYRIRLSSRTPAGIESNVIDLPLKLGRRNSVPILHSVSMPDSVRLPAVDTLKVQFISTVSDSDGLGDIREMFFQRISPPDPTKFQMKDDGNQDPPIEIGPPGAGIRVRSGDDVAGDGRYSFLIPITPTATRRTNVFRFQCIDTFGDTSRSIIDSLIVQ